MRECPPELMDMLGAASALPTDTDGFAPTMAPSEFIFRHALPAGIYGGTMEVFRNMIAQHELKLGRPPTTARKCSYRGPLGNVQQSHSRGIRRRVAPQGPRLGRRNSRIL